MHIGWERVRSDPAYMELVNTFLVEDEVRQAAAYTTQPAAIEMVSETGLPAADLNARADGYSSALSVRKETTKNWPETTTEKTVVKKECFGIDAGNNNNIEHVKNIVNDNVTMW